MTAHACKISVSTAFCAVAVAFLSGCVPTNHRTHLVLGLGVFWIEQTNGVSVVKSDTLGIQAGSGQLNIGASQITIITVPTNSNTVIDLRK